MRYLIIILASLMLVGCTQTKTQTPLYIVAVENVYGVIEKQKNDIVDQATEIAEQRKQIMAMLAMSSNDNDDFFY